MAAEVLGRHRALCPPEDRSLVAGEFRGRARAAAREVFQYGRLRDRAYARSRLLRLLRLAPWASRAVFYLAALSVPAPLLSALISGRRRLRALRTGESPPAS
jgi:hypothetical protein